MNPQLDTSYKYFGHWDLEKKKSINYIWLGGSGCQQLCRKKSKEDGQISHPKIKLSYLEIKKMRETEKIVSADNCPIKSTIILPVTS
jgi:hypothetical protein